MTIEIENEEQVVSEIEESFSKLPREYSKHFPRRNYDLKEWEQMIIENLVERFHFITLSDTKEILYYKDGVYLHGGEDIIAIKAEKLYPEITSYRIKEIQNHIRRRTTVNREELDKDPDILNLKNGLLNLKTFKLSSHAPEYYSVIQFPVPYNPEAKCPEVLNFLKTTLNGHDVKKALALGACIITRNTNFQVSGLTIGEGNNGKGVFNNLNTALIGSKNVSSVSLQEMEEDRFAVADLFGKLLNVCGDLSQRKLKDASVFKKVVGGDLIRAQRKFGQPFSFKANTMMLFSTNSIPDTPDQTYGYYRRWVIINFPNNFEGREDRKLLSKLTTEEELSGYLNLLLESYKMMKRTGKFPALESTKKREEIYLKMQNSVQCFEEEYIEKLEGNIVSKDEVYEAYVSYCKANNIPSESKESFGKKFKSLGYEDARPMINGNRTYVWKNLSIVNTIQRD